MVVPPEAVRAAALVLSCTEGEYDEDDYRVAEDILEAAAPAIRAAERKQIIRPLMLRHQPVSGNWGQSCGTCWARGNSRAAWPCAESLHLDSLLADPQPARGGAA